MTPPLALSCGRRSCITRATLPRSPAMTEKITRREFMLSSAAAAAGMALPAEAQNVVTNAEAASLKWSKAPCRFCGVGCGINVAVKDGQVVATHGDPQAEVNRGVNCVKGYFLSKIMYGADRLTQPLLRMRNGTLRQGRRVPAGQLGPGVRHHGGEVEGGAQGEGAFVGRHVHVRPVDDLGRLCGGEADEGGLSLEQHRPERAPLHGERGGRVHAHLRHRRADGLLRRHRARRRLRAVGLEHGGDAPGAVAAHRRAAPRASARARGGALDLRAPQLRPGGPRRSPSSRRPTSRSSTTSPTTSSRTRR